MKWSEMSGEELEKLKGILSSKVPLRKTNRVRVIEFLKQNMGKWFDDDELSEILGIKPRQQINQICRRLAKEGIIQRRVIDGKKKNSFVIGRAKVEIPEVEPKETGIIKDIKKVKLLEVRSEGLRRLCYEREEGLTESELKTVLAFHLRNKGFNVKVTHRGSHGPDIVAQMKDKKIVIEVKGEGSSPTMRENYFLAIIGEICKRMKDPHADYMLALPAHKDFVNKALNLPKLAKQRLGIKFIFGRKIEEGLYHLYYLLT